MVDQAALVDGLSLDAFSVEEDGLTRAEVDIGLCEVAQEICRRRQSQWIV